MIEFNEYRIPKTHKELFDACKQGNLKYDCSFSWVYLRVEDKIAISELENLDNFRIKEVVKSHMVGGSILKVHFKLQRNIIKMEVLEQDERLRGKGELFSNNGFKIKSIDRPSISYDSQILYIRGLNKDEDDCIGELRMNSPEIAKKQFLKYIELVEGLNEKYEEEFNKDHTKCPNCGVKLQIIKEEE